MYTPISVVIITYNEINNIARCLASVQTIADEIIIVDSFSTDGTQQLATSLGANVIEHIFEGHIEQKNWAITQAKHTYILSLDADEELSTELIEAIKKIKISTLLDGYYMHRLTSFCGQWIHHSGWYPDKKLRLWNSTKGSWQGINPHDEYKLTNSISIATIKADILHYSYNSKAQYHKQQEYFTSLSAKAYAQLGKRANGINLYINPVFKFVKNYVFRLGFLDGKNGLYLCYYNAYYTYVKYKKLKRI